MFICKGLNDFPHKIRIILYLYEGSYIVVDDVVCIMLQWMALWAELTLLLALSAVVLAIPGKT